MRCVLPAPPLPPPPSVNAGNAVRHPGSVSFASALQVNTSLVDLTLQVRITLCDFIMSCVIIALRYYDFTNAFYLLGVFEIIPLPPPALFLQGNLLGASGAEAIMSALASNASLTRLDLSENDVGDAGASPLIEALQANPLGVLRVLSLESECWKPCPPFCGVDMSVLLGGGVIRGALLANPLGVLRVLSLESEDVNRFPPLLAVIVWLLARGDCALE